MSQPWQQQPQPPQHHPYGQPGHHPPVPPQQPGYGPQPGYPPQGPYGQPMQGGYGYPPGFPPQPSGTKPAKAFFLALLVSAGLSLVHAVVLLLSYEDLSVTGLQIAYVVLALALAVGVGTVAGRAGGSNTGVHVAAAFLAALGAYFGVTNGYVFTLLDAGGTDLLEAMLEHEPTAPSQFWWERLEEGVALLGVAVAALGTLAVARIVGKRRVASF
ncbi:hypothetical protein [Streptomyces sp. TRM64462]|uniref:hypothetical protein n=1 Tax=Streptomyces sp. TRM64462 TaxID=2741726 RepID=UPI001586EB10|nr:hypothetical protein [Streptomyces sp. TRM64462]